MGPDRPGHRRPVGLRLFLSCPHGARSDAAGGRGLVRQYFHSAIYGDSVEVTGTSIALSYADGDIWDWAVDWDMWRSMSAIPPPLAPRKPPLPSTAPVTPSDAPRPLNQPGR